MVKKQQAEKWYEVRLGLRGNEDVGYVIFDDEYLGLICW